MPCRRLRAILSDPSGGTERPSDPYLDTALRHSALRRPFPNGRAAVLAALFAAFIIYGSLYPFQFHALAGEAGLITALTTQWLRWPGSRGDLLVNLVLYMPLGLFLALALRGPDGSRRPAILRLLLTTSLGAVLSFAIEVTQLHISARFSSLSDLVLNTTGTLAGAMAALLMDVAGWSRLGVVAPSARRHPAEPFAALLVLAWLGYRLYPYVPVIDLHHYWHSLKPLLLAPTLEPLRTLRLAVLWLVAARLTEAALLGHGLRGWPLLVPGLLLGTLVAQVPILDSRLSLAEVLGLGLGLLAWVILWRMRHGRQVNAFLALVLATVILTERLAPFTFSADPLQPFSWVPFRSVLRGHWEIGLQAMLQKLYLYGALLWLAVRAGHRLSVMAAALATALLTTSLMQTHIPGRSPEVTDAVLGLIVALVFVVLGGSNGAPPMARARWRARRANDKRMLS